MHTYRMWPLVALAALVGCSAELPTEEIDLQDAPEISEPLHPTADGELTRLQPAVDRLPHDVLADRLDRAEVAFVGQVVSTIEHAEVDIPGIGPAPHRFVTWRVEDPVKGGVAGETVTLRFLGGTVGDTTLEVDELPEFVVGERDLLFVGPDNGRAHCPLVDCGSGRLPVVDGQITAPTGHRLVELPDGRIRFGAPLELPVTDPHEEDHDVRVDPVGTPITRADLVRRAVRPGPSAAGLSVTPTQPRR